MGITARLAGLNRMIRMSESSLPNFGKTRARFLLDSLRPARLMGALGLSRGRGPREADTEAGPAWAPELESRAELTIREYLGSQAGLLERAARLGEKAERLERESIPSESARNRAERAHREVVVGLTALRTAFVEAAGGDEAGARTAFDRAIRSLCPAFAPR